MENENIVIDTNVMLSSALNDGAAKEVFDTAIDNYNLLQSRETFSELESVIWREKFDKYLSEEIRNKILDNIRSNSDFIEVTHSTDACRDPKDNKFLELAVSGEAKYIISGDKDLLDIKEYQGIEILSPKQFLERQVEKKLTQENIQQAEPKQPESEKALTWYEVTQKRAALHTPAENKQRAPQQAPAQPEQERQPSPKQAPAPAAAPTPSPKPAPPPQPARPLADAEPAAHQTPEESLWERIQQRQTQQAESQHQSQGRGRSPMGDLLSSHFNRKSKR